MLPNSNTSSSEASTKSNKISELDGKFSFATLNVQHPRGWLILLIFFLQILLLLMARSLPFFSFTSNSIPVSSPVSSVVVNVTPASIPASPTIYFGDDEETGHCKYGKVYVYDLPPVFNKELIDSCQLLSPWASRCEALSNNGFGRRATGLDGLIPENLTHAWYWTDQFALELIHHHRMMNYRCRTSEPDSAKAFYIPFYAGLAVAKYLWSNDSTAEDRDRHCQMMLTWIRDQPFWNKSNGWDHFITMGRITWDFRRSNDEDWGSSCIYLPSMRNITRLLIERNSWDYFDVGVPYPTGFHPSNFADVNNWQQFVRTHQRTSLYCFAGATRGFIKNDFRGLLLNQCYSDPDSCRVVNCSGSKCSNGTSVILETFLDSNFCLQPRGDSFTRRSIFDCMVAGSIPVFFWNRTAYSQYEWFLPAEPRSYSVFIDRNDVRNGTTVRSVLERISKEEVRKMREKVIEYIPRIVYVEPRKGLKGISDAFDLAVEGVLRRIKEQEKEGFKW